MTRRRDAAMTALFVTRRPVASQGAGFFQLRARSLAAADAAPEVVKLEGACALLIGGAAWLRLP